MSIGSQSSKVDQKDKLASKPGNETRSRPKRAKSAKGPMSNWHIIREQVKYIDLLIEVCDARAPQSSRHPRVKEIFANKPVLLVLNKADLADKTLLENYSNKLNKTSPEKSIALSVKSKQHRQAVLKLITQMTAEKQKALAKKGINTPVVRICVIGMPNVGKSSLINWLTGHKNVKVGNKPGVTKGPQWIKLQFGLELLDTPGILPRDNMDKKTNNILSMLNLIKTDQSETETLANETLSYLTERYPVAIKNYLDTENLDEINLETLAKKRNFLSSGGKYNLDRAGHTLLSDFGCGKLGGVFFDEV